MPSSGPGTFGIVADPLDSENRVLQVQKQVTGSGYGVSRAFEAPSGAEKTRISLRFMTSEFASGGAFNLKFGSASNLANTALSFLIAHRGESYFIAHRTTERGYGTRLGEIVPNAWYQLDVEYKPAGPDDTEMVVCINGEQVAVLDEYFHDGDESRLPIRDIKHVSFYVWSTVAATLHVDDVKIESK